jgi:hypothetical protein
MLLATEDHVFVTSQLSKDVADDDVITVLKASDGSYVETIDVRDTIVEIGRLGDSLVVATPKDVKFLPLP